MGITRSTAICFAASSTKWTNQKLSTGVTTQFSLILINSIFFFLALYTFTWCSVEIHVVTLYILSRRKCIYQKKQTLRIKDSDCRFAVVCLFVCFKLSLSYIYPYKSSNTELSCLLLVEVVYFSEIFTETWYWIHLIQSCLQAISGHIRKKIAMPVKAYFSHLCRRGMLGDTSDVSGWSHPMCYHPTCL